MTYTYFFHSFIALSISFNLLIRSVQDLVEEARNIAAGIPTKHRHGKRQKKSAPTNQADAIRSVDDIIASLKHKTEHGEV